MWIRVFPDRPITNKPAEVGMGKGKGDPKHFVFEVRPGRVLFELDGVAGCHRSRCAPPRWREAPAQDHRRHRG
jgi:ribosomal protein L16